MNSVIGVDISAATFDAAYEREGTRNHKAFANRPSGYKALLAWTEHLPGERIFSMEATGDYSYGLANYLYERGFTVYVNNPRLVKWFARGENQDDKTDKLDAFVNMRFCEEKMAKLRAWKPMPEHISCLRELTRERAKLIAFRDSCTLRSRRSSNTLIRSQQKVLLAASSEQIRRLDDEIKRCISANDELNTKFKLLRSIKGIGPVSAATFLAEVPWFAEFRNKADLVRFAGLNPVSRDSGTTLRGPRFISKKGNAHLRKALYMPALVAVKHNPRCSQKYLDLLGRGKKPKQALVAVMRQLLCFAFGVLSTGQPAYTAERSAKSA